MGPSNAELDIGSDSRAGSLPTTLEEVFGRKIEPMSCSGSDSVWYFFTDPSTAASAASVGSVDCVQFRSLVSLGYFKLNKLGVQRKHTVIVLPSLLANSQGQIVQIIIQM